MNTKAKEFLNIASQFKLGKLVTEGFHPLTRELSQLVKRDVGEALNLLQQVDREAISMMRDKSDIVWQMAQDIQATFKAGNNVYICGCGATGRLALVLETLYRQMNPTKNQVLSFMAGGDFALIKSVESFEDRVDYGERQLTDMGFGPNDLLLSPTEGGETPFVIGATNLAANISKRSPYFLYCNPDELLQPIQRSREVLENPKIHKVNLTVGPMAISGSTRMQASTVLMLAIGMGLIYEFESKSLFGIFYQDFLSKLVRTDYQVLKPLTSLEARLYKSGKYLNYIADHQLAISVLTDTTERSPTFSLRAFENMLENINQRSLSYLFIPHAESSEHGWAQLLLRPPRPLDWGELNGKIDLNMILGFDISKVGMNLRAEAVLTENFRISYERGDIRFTCQDETVVFNWEQDLFFDHLMVKMLLNAHSTLVMGLLDRYQGNVMTWVRSSNNKLIDRSARYIIHLLKETGMTASYEEVVAKIFDHSEMLQENEPIVLKVLNSFIKGHN